MSAGPVNRGREYVAVARNKGMAAFFGQPTTLEIARAEVAAKRLHWPEARVAVYRLVYDDAAQSKEPR